MRFLYYIIDCDGGGQVTGTNDVEQAARYAELEWPVIYTQDGSLVHTDRDFTPIEAAVRIDESGFEEEEDEDGDLE